MSSRRDFLKLLAMLGGGLCLPPLEYEPMQMGDVFQKLASGTPLALDEIEFMRLQLNQAQNVNAAVSGWLTGGDVRFSTLIANKGIFDIVPAHGSYFTSTTSCVASTPTDIPFSNPYTLTFTPESAILPGADYTVTYPGTHKKLKYAAWTAQRTIVWMASFEAASMVSGTRVKIETKYYNALDDSLAATVTRYDDTATWQGPQSFLFVDRYTADPALYFTFHITQYDSTDRTIALYLGFFVI